MTEPRAQQRSPPSSPSYIPIAAPRPSRSTLPSSLSVPQLGLVPPSRRPSASVSGSPSQSTPPSAVIVGIEPIRSPPTSGLSSFRSLKSFLPFVSSGKQAPSGGTPSGLKSPFSGFSSARRASTGDNRKNSSSYVRAEQAKEIPIISIQASPQHHVESSPSVSVSSEKDHGHGTGPPVITYTPDPPLSTELSTIIESDMSGLSKHLPALDDSRDSSFRESFFDRAERDTSRDISDDTRRTAIPKPSSSPPLHGSGLSSCRRTPEPHDTTLDLSTSKITEEVMHALKGKNSGGGWLSGVVVEDDEDSPHASAEEPGNRVGKSSGQDPNGSFHLEALDPDLAALLSPNRITGRKQPGLRIPAVGVTPSVTPPPNASDIPPRALPSSWLTTPQTTTATLPPSPNGHSPASVSGTDASSPNRPTPSTSLPRPSLSRGPSNSSVPRFMRSVTDRTSPLRSEKFLAQSIAARAASDPTLPLPFDEGRRASSDSVYPRRQAPPSPLSSDPPAQIQRHNTEEGGYRRSTSSRLATPSRPSLYTPASSRALRPSTAAPSVSGSSPGGWEADSVSPSSRASSALGSAPTTRRLQRSRQSMESEVRPSFDRERSMLYVNRSRKRSMSVGEGVGPSGLTPPPTRPVPEWLGPRTVKAFAAAGLLENDREREQNGNSSYASRFGSLRGSSERDYRSQYNPSRMAFSEAGSASSWRSASRSEMASVHGGPLDTPRTTFSGGSTAPTSVSGASSPQRMNEIQSLQDKHSMETTALLAALADSQRTAQMLREENGRLSTRVEELEAQLVDAHAQLRRQQYNPPLARSVLDRIAAQRPPSSDGGHRRHFRTQSLTPSVKSASSQRVSPRASLSASVESGDEVVHSTLRPNDTYRSGVDHKRISSASSEFALPPSNMSLLMHEDAGSGGRSIPSSTRSTTPPPPPTAPKHIPSMSVSSTVGNISPTTTSFSMHDMAGSPRSLFLRPEHELHLGDMASLDLQFGDDDEDEDEGGG